MKNISKYKNAHAHGFAALKDRRWPDNKIERAPVWCSVDLRDGNQALAVPMNVNEKLELYETLLKVGFKEIEVGFPSASDTEFRFLRKLIEEKRIPDGVAVQILTQSRDALIRKSFEALRGAKEAIVHLYNSTSALQRKVTFKMTRNEIKQIAVGGAKLVRALADEYEAQGTHIRMEYSPESFSDTEMDFALEVCEAVKEIWKPTPQNKIILNLPDTVQYFSPNVHADQIEYMSRSISGRDSVLISLHTHNDRGTGIAATEFGLMAGADRVEGTLFGNGERTGNLDIVNVALNMYSEGVDPHLNLDNLPEIREVYERCTRMQVPPRHPYAGDLVFTAFSGSHQDAIKKGMDMRKECGAGGVWEVPYLLIDPHDIGRDYEAIIRINSQSGKGGVAYILGNDFGYDLPKAMHPEVGDFVNSKADALGKELDSAEIANFYTREFVNVDSPLKLESYKMHYSESSADKAVHLSAKIRLHGEEKVLEAAGNGPINAFVNGLEHIGIKNFRLRDYRSHAIGMGSATDSAAYIRLISLDEATDAWGMGIDSNIEAAGIKALVSAYNRLSKKLGCA